MVPALSDHMSPPPFCKTAAVGLIWNFNISHSGCQTFGLFVDDKEMKAALGAAASVWNHW